MLNCCSYFAFPGGGEKWGGNGVGDDLYSYGFDGAQLWTGFSCMETQWKDKLLLKWLRLIQVVATRWSTPEWRSRTSAKATWSGAPWISPYPSWPSIWTGIKSRAASAIWTSTACSSRSSAARPESGTCPNPSQRSMVARFTNIISIGALNIPTVGSIFQLPSCLIQIQWQTLNWLD